MSIGIYYEKYPIQHSNVNINIHKFSTRLDNPKFDVNYLKNYFKETANDNIDTARHYLRFTDNYIQSLIKYFKNCNGLGICFRVMDDSSTVVSYEIMYDSSDPNSYFILGHELGHIMNGDCDPSSFSGRTLYQEMLADNYAFKVFGNKLKSKPDFFVNDNLNKEGPSKWLTMWKTFGNEAIIRQANINRKWMKLKGE